MARTDSRTLKMVFDVDGSKSWTLSLADPKTGLTKSEVVMTANLIVEKEFFIASGLPVAALKDTYIQAVTYEEIE